MFTEYIINLKSISFIELLIQIILLYNLFQILKQYNFYYILAYFTNFILFLGLYLIIFDLDIACIILWIIYGGVIIVFFIYSLMWIDSTKNTNNYKNIFYFLFFIFYFLFFYYNNTTSIKLFVNWNNFWIDYYSYLKLDLNEELDNLGWGILYYSTFFFIIISYMLFIACCTSIVIILNSKKIKYSFINIFYQYIKNNINLFYFNNYKIQFYYSQEYENINQINTIVKNFKISHYFHKIKNLNKKV